MVEGHHLHRLVHSFNKSLKGKRFRALSPNGKFIDGATAIDGKLVQKLDAIGKNLFAFFEGDHVIHVHFGMSGRWALFDYADAPEPTVNTRLRLESKEHDIVTHLSAMIVQLGNHQLFDDKKKLLGEDPLREDADPERLWPRIQKSKKVIGRLLMDQTLFAGVGNIYRAEILFKAGVHPNRLASVLSREEFDRIWEHSVDLLQRGFQTGSILTVDKDEAIRLGTPGLRRYIYNQSKCGRCKTPVNSWVVDTRTCYACPHCQPLKESEALPTELISEVRVFNSHCAKETLEVRLRTPEKCTVAELRAELIKLGVEPKGKKSALVELYKQHSMSSGLTLENPEVATVADLRAELTKIGVKVPKGTKKAGLVQIYNEEAGKSQNALKEEIKQEETEAEPDTDTTTSTVSEVEPSAEQEDLSRLRVVELKTRLLAAGLGTKGTKAELLDRLQSHLAELVLVKREPRSSKSSLKSPRARNRSKPRAGTKHLKNVATAAEAAEEKRRAGEKRNVEHIAEDDFRRRSTRLRRVVA